MIAPVPPAIGRILPPTATAPPTPTPTTIHPTWALTVWPLLTVNVFEALTSVGVMVGLMLWFVVGFVVVVASGGDDFGILLGPGWDPRELGDVCSWSLVVPVIGMTVVFGMDVRVDIDAFPLLFRTIIWLGGVF